jgi:hypothetical protein
MRISKTEIAYFAVLLLLLLLVFGLNWIAGSTITSPQNLAADLASPADSPQDWNIQDWSVVKYRALFRLIVRGTWSVFFAPVDAAGFYAVFVSCSFLLFFGTLVALYFYLRALEFDQRTSFAGCLLFLGSPPVLLAYKYPVYTREDPLAYLLVVVGLYAAFKSMAFLVSVISAAAALTRETTLILPLAYFLSAEESWHRRILVWVLPVLAFVGIRIVWGLVVGNSFESSILNFQAPVETAAFLFCVFGVLWLPYLSGLAARWQKGVFPIHAWRVLTSSGPIVFVLVMLATLTIGRAREIRISFLLFPWAIPFALDWFRSHSGYFLERARKLDFWAFAFLTLAVLAGVMLYLDFGQRDLATRYLADFRNGYWLFLGTVHLAAAAAIWFPILRRQRTRAAV